LKKTVLKTTLNEVFKNKFFKNIGKKVLALAIAIVLWLVANIEHDIEKSISINVNYQNLPPELIIVNKPPESLNIRVRGPRTQLASVSPRNIAFTVDLSNASPGVSKFEVQTDQIKTPRGVQVTGITPAEIKVDVDQIIKKEVDVKPVIRGPADTGYELVGAPVANPSRVEIKGPRNIVSQINAIPTDSVSITGVKSKFTIQVPLKSPQPSVDIVNYETVRVTVDIREQTVEKHFDDIEIQFVNFDDRDFEAMGPLKAELEFAGPYSIIRDLNSDDIKVFVDGSNLGRSKRLARLEVNVSYPHRESIMLKKKVPATIEVKLN
jgi:YbbR domain-containing protein